MMLTCRKADKEIKNYMYKQLYQEYFSKQDSGVASCKSGKQSANLQEE